MKSPRKTRPGPPLLSIKPDVESAAGFREQIHASRVRSSPKTSRSTGIAGPGASEIA